MSKPITRAIISVLIALVLVIAIFSSVQGAMLTVGTKNSHSYIDAGVNLGLRHNRASGQESVSSGASFLYTNDEDGHDCDHDSMFNPEDY